MEISLLTAVLHFFIYIYTHYFTKWVEATSIPTKEAKGVASFLYSLFCRHGVPKHIQSDQEREFVNSLNDHLIKLTGVQHVISTAYHPQSNGLDERFNETLQRALIKMIEENQSEWDKFLDSVLFAYRTSKQASTQFSPFFLLYGRELRLPKELSISKKVLHRAFTANNCINTVVLYHRRLIKKMPLMVLQLRLQHKKKSVPIQKKAHCTKKAT